MGKSGVEKRREREREKKKCEKVSSQRSFHSAASEIGQKSGRTRVRERGRSRLFVFVDKAWSGTSVYSKQERAA